MAAPTSLLKGFEKVAVTTKPDPRKRITISDPDTRGLYVRITPSGGRTYTIVARDPGGKQVWKEVGPVDNLDLTTAREKAKEGVRRIKQGLEAFPPPEAPPPPPNTFKTVSDDFIKLHVRNKERTLRSADEIERIFKVHLWPEWKDRAFVEIRRGDVTRLLDKIEANNGAGMAHHVLAIISKLCNWYAVRDEDYVSPIIRGMGRTKPAERARERMLADDEIRLLWSVASERGVFGALLKTCLLTAQRKGKVETMRWSDIAEDGTWTMPTEKREKTNPGELRLPPMTLAIVKAQSKVRDNPYVFPGRGEGPLVGFSPLKRRFDAKMLERLRKAATDAGADAEAVAALTVKPWVIHDLRRTAKSLMARAGVRPDVSERVLGHVIRGVEGVYDRHRYVEEKAEALKALAALVERIINPPVDNVVQIETRR